MLNIPTMKSYPRMKLNLKPLPTFLNNVKTNI